MHLVAAAVSLLLALPWATVGATPEPVPFLEWEVVSRRPHDTGSFTQGLLLDGQGRLFESAGQYGESDLREVDPLTGAVLRQRPQPDRHFSEGLAMVGDELVQLTYREGLARRFDADTFELLERHRYEGQGWGLCYDGERLVMSNGSARLTFRDADTFEPLGSVLVTIGGEPLPRLNELECVDGEVWANVWLTDAVVRIDPDEGRVTGVLDLRGVLEPHPAEIDPSAVLNGIAYDTVADTFLVTGKYWPELIEIRLRAAGSAAGP